MGVHEKIHRLKANISSPRGKDVLAFCIAMVVATLLWFSTVINEEVTRDVRFRLEITNIPDSVHNVTTLPTSLNASVRGAGLQLLFSDFFDNRPIRIDYAHFQQSNVISLNEQQLKTLIQNTVGSECYITSVKPDTVGATFTSRKPVRLPVTIDARITTLPNCMLKGKPRSSSDSVWVYSLEALPKGMTAVVTKPLVLDGVTQSGSARVALTTPAGSMADPDSVTISYTVEPMIMRTQKVAIKTVNVPDQYRLIVMPATVNVNYMMPMSQYDDAIPEFTVTADYNTLASGNPDRRVIGLSLSQSGGMVNAYLAVDSAEYIIEKR